jgi:hypothetical protein
MFELKLGFNTLRVSPFASLTTEMFASNLDDAFQGRRSLLSDVSQPKIILTSQLVARLFVRLIAESGRS